MRSLLPAGQITTGCLPGSNSSRLSFSIGEWNPPNDRHAGAAHHLGIFIRSVRFADTALAGFKAQRR